MVPVSGPKYYFQEVVGYKFPGYVFSEIMHLIFKYGEIANGAFPSSHVTMATVILMCALRYEKWIFWMYLPLTLSLFTSTVYLEAHYVVDVLSGVVVGVFFYAIGGRVKGLIERVTGCEGTE
jgi:membrane-associated phospholipid phosphatase